MSARLILSTLFFSLWTFLIVSPFTALAQDRHVAIELFADTKTVAPGDTVTIGIQKTIDPRWHTYWINPGDSGEPTRVNWSGLHGVKVEPIQWPVPNKIPIGPLTNYGFEGTVTLLQEITFPNTLPEGPITLSADISLLVCEEICIPEFGTYTMTFNDGSAGDPVAITEARSHLPIPMSWPVEHSLNGEVIDFTIMTESTDKFAKAENIEIFPVEGGLIANAEPPITQILDTGLLISRAAGELETSSIPKTDIVVAYTNEDGIRKAIQLSSSLSDIDKLEAMAASTPGKTEPKEPAPSAMPDYKVGFFGAVLFAIFGGLILNLMPCVFPVLSLKALKLVQLQDKEEKKVRMQGLAYTAGVISSFLLIATILIALKAAGAEIGWGFQLQNPVVVAVLAYLLFALGLNLSGYFEIGGNFMNVGSSLAQKDGLGGSFFTGALATAVATPCTAPFMGVAMGYALVQPAYISLIVFIALGFGLALPYLALCYVPALRSALPRPGAWMDTFKQLLAFPMFASAAWLIWVLSQQAGSIGVLITLMGLVTLVFGIWLGKKNIKALAIIVILISLIPALTVKTDPYRGAIPQEITESHNWEPYSPERLELALAMDEPVFINMTAAWCITCKVNERVALSTDETKMLFSKNNVQYFKGDWTNRDASITEFLEHYGRNGVPLYVYYGPKDPQSGRRPEAVVLPQLLTPAIVRETIEAL